jgi:peptidyl-dipeptidase A
MLNRIIPTAVLVVLALTPLHASAAGTTVKSDAAQFLEFYNRAYQRIYTANAEAQWKSMTDVTPEHTGQRIGADEVMASFCGNPYVIEQARRFLESRSELDDVTVRQLKVILRRAAESPGTLPEIVSKRVAAEARQAATMDAFEFKWRRPGATGIEPITANRIDDVLTSSTNLAERLAVWQASKESGVALKPGLLELRGLRNRVAREMGYSSFFDLQVSAYDMSSAEMRQLLDQLTQDLRPLYLQLHCWARYELARKYGQPVPKLIPAHWLNNRWSQEWPGLVEGVDLDPLLADKSPQWIVQRAVDYGESLGFPKVP